MLKKTHLIMSALAFALTPAPAAFAAYEEYCLRNTGGYSAGFRIEVVKEGVDARPPGAALRQRSYYKGSGSGAVNSSETKCVDANDLGINPGDGIRFYVDPLGDIANRGTRECGKNRSHTHGHEGMFLVPDGQRQGKLVFRSWGALYGPSCGVESGERMHSACAATADGMENAGCNRWELDQNPRNSNVSLTEVVEDDLGVGRFADLVSRARHDINARDGDGQSPLHAAAEMGRASYVDYIIAQGGDLNIRDNDGATPLMKAVSPLEKGGTAILEKLLTAGANPNLAAHNGEFPLWLAAEAGDLEMVRVLVEFDAELDAQNSETGKTALDRAKQQGRENVAGYLRAQGAEERLYPLEEELLNIVATDAGVEWLERAMENGHDLDTTDGRGTTALHLAAQLRRTDYAAELARLGAAIDIRDDQGRTPLLVAIESDPYYPGVVQALLLEGADPNIARRDGVFPLYLAVEMGRPDIVRMLTVMSDMLEVNQRNSETEKTALGLAEEYFASNNSSDYARIREILLLENAVR